MAEATQAVQETQPGGHGTRYAVESSRTTHGVAECLDACRLLATVIVRALAGSTKEEVLLNGGNTFAGSPRIRSIARGAYRDKACGEITGSGYVVECLEAALWCFLRTDDFETAILQAANLGDDADTTAAVCGQVAGAYYGASGIPDRWLERLAMKEQIADLADRLHSGKTV